jgi:hypothetical protein
MQRYPTSSSINNPLKFIYENFPEGLDFLFHRITQVFVSESVSSFREQLQKKYTLSNYFDVNSPALIFGMYRREDYAVAINHKTNKTIFWCGGDIRGLIENKNRVFNLDMVRRIKNVRHICASRFISNSLTQARIEHELIPVTPVMLDLKPCPRGDCIYFYSSPRAEEFYGGQHLETIRQETGIKILCANHNTYNRDELIGVYKKCFIGLRMTPHDGMPTTGVELGLMGRRIIHNGEQPNSINYTDLNSVIDLIKKEYATRHEDNTYIADAMREYLNISDSWLNA